MKAIALKIIALAAVCVAITGCYTDAVENFTEFSFQLPLEFDIKYENKYIPRYSVDFANLYEYQAYKDNRDQIAKAEVFQMNYWIDSIVYEGGIPFNPGIDTLAFEYVRYSIQFAKPLGDPQSLDSTQFIPDPDYPPIVLGEFKDVRVSDFYRKPHHIIEMADSTSKVISMSLKERPYYYLITEYSAARGQTEPERFFPLIKAHFDLVIRFVVKV
ncbi:MAG: hypothetical protein ACM3U1_05620 [Chloroflexota bacterium]